MFSFLQATETIATIAAQADSVKEAVLDTVGKSDVEKSVIESINTLTTTPTGEILSSLGEKALQFGLKLVAAILIYIIGGYLIKVIKKALGRLFTRKSTDAAIVSFISSLVTAILWVLVIIIAVGTLGVNTTSLAALLAAGGMAIGMALSGTVQNFAGGIMILVFKPFKAGDYIEAQGFAGTVTEVNITSTKILTVDNRVVIIPNGPLSSGSVNNFSKMEFRRVDFAVCVEYGTDKETVKEALMEVAKSDERILTANTKGASDPFVAIAALNPNNVEFTFRVWTKGANYWGVFFDTNEKIYAELIKKGVKFACPQVKVHMSEK